MSDTDIPQHAEVDPVTLLPAAPEPDPAPAPYSAPPRRPRGRPRSSLLQAAANIGVVKSLTSSHGSKRRSKFQMDGSFPSVCALLGAGASGAKTLLNLVRATAPTSPDAASFLALLDAKTQHLRNALSPQVLEDLCTEFSVPWPKLVGWAFEAAAATGQHLAAMKAALALPEVVDKTIKFAKRKDGYRDRDFLFRSTGFVPTPGGIAIINQIAANAQARNIDAGGEAFVPFERDVIDITEPPSDRILSPPDSSDAADTLD